MINHEKKTGDRSSIPTNAGTPSKPCKGAARRKAVVDTQHEPLHGVPESSSFSISMTPCSYCQDRRRTIAETPAIGQATRRDRVKTPAIRENPLAQKSPRSTALPIEARSMPDSAAQSSRSPQTTPKHSPECYRPGRIRDLLPAGHAPFASPRPMTIDPLLRGTSNSIASDESRVSPSLVTHLCHAPYDPKQARAAARPNGCAQSRLRWTDSRPQKRHG